MQSYASFRRGAFYRDYEANITYECVEQGDRTFANAIFSALGSTTPPEAENRVFVVQLNAQPLHNSEIEANNPYFITYDATLTNTVVFSPSGSYTTIVSSLPLNGGKLEVESGENLIAIGSGTTLYIEPYQRTESSGLTWRGNITADPTPAIKNSEYALDSSGGAFTISLAAVAANIGDEIAFLKVDDSTNSVTITGSTNGDRSVEGQGTRWTFRLTSVGWIAIPQPANIKETRLGEFFFAKSGSKTLAEGYLAVSPGTVANGATTFPKWAALYPEFVSGNDIVFPADVEGMFLRNVGGLAAAEGQHQDHATALPQSGWDFADMTRMNVSNGVGNNRGYGVSGGSAGTNNPKTEAGFDVIGGDAETRPNNRAYQLYTVVDGHQLQVPAGTVIAVDDSLAEQALPHEGKTREGYTKYKRDVTGTWNGTQTTIMSESSFQKISRIEGTFTIDNGAFEVPIDFQQGSQDVRWYIRVGTGLQIQASGISGIGSYDLTIYYAR